MSQEKQTPIEAINEYYMLKDKYESTYYDKYVKPILKSKNTKKEKRVEFGRLPKPECINCKRNVGTIFNISYDMNEVLRRFIAKCGDLTDPCPLDIQINYSVREQYNKVINEGLSSVEKLKLDIIKQKNNALFFEKGQNIVTIFEKLTSSLKKETEQLGFSIEKDILKNDNPEKINLLNKSIDEFGIGYLLPFKQMIRDYLDKNNELILNEAINFYVNEMIPKLKEIQSLKYEVNFVEYDIDEQIYKLIQRTNSIESKEEYFESDDKVLKFIKGLRKVNNEVKNTKTKKVMEEDLFKKNKTRKLKPTLEIVGDEEEVVEEPLQGAIEEQESVIEEPVLEGGMEDGEDGEEEEKDVILPIKFEGNNSEEKYYDSEDD
jgi:hypothetical protein